MSVDKLLAQADKLLDKGKSGEAITKLQEALALDPNSDRVANKLARLYVDERRPQEAVAIYKQLGVKAASSGKSQQAVALLKQGLAIDPQNLELLERMAPECEAIGKVTEAAIYAQRVLAYYVPRKRYLDALNSFVLIAKAQPNEESIRLAWIELLMYARNEMQLRRALVCFCGPPGIQLAEFSVGGDPTKLSASLYRALAALLPFYPGEPTLSYALAWIAYRKGNELEAIKFILDCFSKDQNFVLAILLFARILSEKQRLEETLFVYQYAKERIGLDRSIDQRALLQQLQAFEEKNGWLNFADGVSANDEMSATSFLEKFTMPAQTDESALSEAEFEAEKSGSFDTFGNPSKSSGATGEIRRGSGLIPAPLPTEVDLGSMGQDSDASLEIQFTGDSSKVLQPVAIQKTVVEKKVEEKKVELTADAINKSHYDSNALAPQKVVPQAPPELSKGNIIIEEATKLFSPLELLDAQKQQQLHKKPKYRKSNTGLINALPPQADQEATQIFSPSISVGLQESIKISQEATNDGTQVLALGSAFSKEIPKEEAKEIADETIFETTSSGTTQASDEIVEETSEQVSAIEEDLGEDLLQQATKLIAKPLHSTAAHLPVAKTEPPTKTISYKDLLLRAEQHINKKNWFLAKRILRAAARSGADAEIVNKRLAEVRKLSEPLFATESSDYTDDRTTDQVLRELEIEVGFEADELELNQIEVAVSKIRTKIDSALENSDPRVRLDLGVAFLEMGLFKEASVQFLKAADTDPKLKEEASYLAAQSMFRMKKFPDAISLLKEITADPRRPELQKIPAFYLLGEVYSEMKQPKKARRYFEKVADLDANYRSIREKLERS